MLIGGLAERAINLLDYAEERWVMQKRAAVKYERKQERSKRSNRSRREAAAVQTLQGEKRRQRARARVKNGDAYKKKFGAEARGGLPDC